MWKRTQCRRRAPLWNTHRFYTSKATPSVLPIGCYARMWKNEELLALKHTGHLFIYISLRFDSCRLCNSRNYLDCPSNHKTTPWQPTSQVNTARVQTPWINHKRPDGPQNQRACLQSPWQHAIPLPVTTETGEPRWDADKRVCVCVFSLETECKNMVNTALAMKRFRFSKV